MEKVVYLVGGSNGAGKTTFAKEFIEHFEMKFLNADEIAKEFNPNDTEGGKAFAGRIFFKRLNKYIENEESFIVESTLSGRYMTKIIERLHLKEYRVILIYTYLDSAELAIERVKIRVKEGGHHIPEEDVRRRYLRSKSYFFNSYKDLVDEWQLFYNSEKKVVPVACGSQQDIEILDMNKFGLIEREVLA